MSPEGRICYADRRSRHACRYLMLSCASDSDARCVVEDFHRHPALVIHVPQRAQDRARNRCRPCRARADSHRWRENAGATVHGDE